MNPCTCNCGLIASRCCNGCRFGFHVDCAVPHHKGAYSGVGVISYYCYNCAKHKCPDEFRRMVWKRCCYNQITVDNVHLKKIEGEKLTKEEEMVYEDWAYKTNHKEKIGGYITGIVSWEQ